MPWRKLVGKFTHTKAQVTGGKIPKEFGEIALNNINAFSVARRKILLAEIRSAKKGVNFKEFMLGVGDREGELFSRVATKAALERIKIKNVDTNLIAEKVFLLKRELISINEFSSFVQAQGVPHDKVVDLANLAKGNIDLILTEMILQLEKHDSYN